MATVRSIVISALLAAALGGCSAHKAPGIKGTFPVIRVAEAVYVVQGPNEEPSRANQGFVNNPGFVVAPRGVVVVDPGSSVQVGELLLRSIARVTDKPVVAVFDTAIDGDHWLGNQAIRAAFPHAVIYADPRMIAMAAVEGKNWIRQLNRATDGAARGTRVVLPDLGVDDGDTLGLGGMHFRIFHTPVAHTDNDIMVEAVEAKAIFLGDNVLVRRTADLDAGDFQGSIAAIDVALSSDAVFFIPGHGAPGGRETALIYRGYLAALYGSVERCGKLGLNEQAMRPVVYKDLARYHAWTGFDKGLDRLIHRARLQIATVS
ncbi:MAG: MBL fold metallo-hydrolase [Acidiferrobacterales bacterium]